MGMQFFDLQVLEARLFLLLDEMRVWCEKAMNDQGNCQSVAYSPSEGMTFALPHCMLHLSVFYIIFQPKPCWCERGRRSLAIGKQPLLNVLKSSVVQAFRDMDTLLTKEIIIK
jgi:hypothetical protein